MRNFLVFISFTLISFGGFSQTVIVDYNWFIGGDSSHTTAEHAVQTSDGGIIFTGISYCLSKVAGNCNANGDIPNNTKAIENVVVVKTDANRNINWAKIFGGSNYDAGLKVCETPTGYAVLARTKSSDGDVTGFKGTTDTWLITLDKNGNKVWDKCYGSIYDDVPISFICTPDSGFAILGCSNGYGDDIPTHYTTSTFVYDWFLIKIDKTGKRQWSRSIGGDGDENNRGALLMVDTFYYLISSSDSRNHDCTDTSWHNGKNTKFDYYVLKLDITGNVLWNKSYGGSEYDNVENAIYDPRDSSIIIVGYSNSNDNLAAGNNSMNGHDDMLALKIKMNGGLVWNHMYGGAWSEDFPSVSLDKNHGYLLCTNSYSSGLGSQDIWVFFTDSMGDIQKEMILGGSQPEFVRSVFNTQLGYAVAGNSTSGGFNLGKNSTRWGKYDHAYISYFYYWPAIIEEKTTVHKELKLYPNPTQDKIRIEPLIEGKHKWITVEVTDQAGRVMFREHPDKRMRSNDLDTSEWPTGMYMLKVTFENGIYATGTFIHK